MGVRFFQCLELGVEYHNIVSELYSRVSPHPALTGTPLLAKERGRG